MRLHGIIITGLLATTVGVVALAEPTTQPVKDTTDPALDSHPDRRINRNGPNHPLLDSFIKRQQGTPDQIDTNISEQEWGTIMQFMKSEFPNRTKAFEDFAEARGMQRPEPLHMLRGRIITKYRALQQMKTEQPEEYVVTLRREKQIDEIWGLSVKLNRNTGTTQPTDDEKTQLQKDLHDKVVALVDQTLTDRAERIKKLKAKLEQDQATLDSDLKSREKIVQRQIDKITNDVMHGGPTEFDGQGGVRPRRFGPNGPGGNPGMPPNAPQ